jgi:hypothetical protein
MKVLSNAETRMKMKKTMEVSTKMNRKMKMNMSMDMNVKLKLNMTLQMGMRCRRFASHLDDQVKAAGVGRHPTMLPRISQA